MICDNPVVYISFSSTASAADVIGAVLMVGENDNYSYFPPKVLYGGLSTRLLGFRHTRFLDTRASVLALQSGKVLILCTDGRVPKRVSR